jgi:RNA helicase armi
MKIKFPRDHFTHVIIDEAGQCVEAESLIPLTLLSKDSGQVILAGDPKQLGATSNSQYTKRLRMDCSLLERLLATNDCYAQTYGPNLNEFDSRFVTKLKINYRSLPSILSLYNNLFYSNELQGVINDSDSSEANLLGALQEVLWKGDAEKNEKCWVYFINVEKGVNQKVAESSSWHNEKEAAAISSFLWKLNNLGLPSKDIGVVS